MSLKGKLGVLDIRTVGLVAAFDLASKPDGFGKTAYAAMEKGFHEEGILLRIAGDTLVVTPPLIISEAQIGEVFEKVGKMIAAVV